MRIRTRVALLVAVSVLVSVAALAFWIEGELEPRYREAQEEVLVDMAETLAVMLAKQTRRGAAGRVELDAAAIARSLEGLRERRVDAQIHRHRKTEIDIRIYVTDRAGMVLFDSDAGRAVGQNYSRWRDVWLTLRGRYGARTSVEDPAFADVETMYVAAAIRHQNAIIGVVSVGKPTASIASFRQHLLRSLTLVSVLIALAALALGFVVNRWLSRPLEQLQDYALAVARNERVILPRLGRSEIADVGQAMETMRQALDGKRYVTEYVQALTHELKAPIAAIRGAAELLDEPLPEGAQRRFVGNIATQTERMQGLIDRLLELAALEYRNTLSRIETVAIEPLVCEVVSDLKPLADARGIAVSITTAPKAAVLGDRFLLSKALTNVLKNAIECSPAQGTITITTSNREGRLELAVADQGPGVPDYALVKLTERFYALTKPDGQKGSGLGLSFVKEIAELHGALLEFENAREAGLVVRLVFKAHEA